MTTERKLLPLPPMGWDGWDPGDMRNYARANMAPLEAEIARLREALEHISGLSRSQFWQTQDMLDAILDVAAAALREAE